MLPFEGGAGASGGMGANEFQKAIDMFTRAVGKLTAVFTMLGTEAPNAVPSEPNPSNTPVPYVPAQSSSGGGFTTAGVAGTIAAGMGPGGGIPQGLARTALSYAPAPVAAAVTGLAAVGNATQQAQVSLNTLQYQSSIYGQNYNTTRIGAMGTAGNVLGGQRQIEWGLNPQDMAATYASLQQTTTNLNPYSAVAGGNNVIGAMNAVNIANPAMSGVQNSGAVAQLYSPQTSLNMMQMGYGATPRQIGTGNAQPVGATLAPFLNRLGSGNPLTQQQLFAQMAPNQKGYVGLQNLTGASPGQMNQYTNTLAMQNALMTGQGGQKPMDINQVDQLFAQLNGSTNQFNAAKNTLQQYGIQQSAIQAQKSQAGNQAESISDTSQGYIAGMQLMTRAQSDFNTALHKVINSIPGGRGVLGFAESVISNIFGGGSATMYDSTVPDQAPTTLLPGTSGPLMIAYYVSGFSAPTKSKFPANTQYVTIDQAGTRTDADAVDMETDAVYPASAVSAWLKKAGGTKVVYATPSNKALLDATKPPKYEWWEAAWDGSRTVSAGAVAHQFASNRSYDSSVVSNPGAFKGGGTSASGGTPGSTTTTTSSSTTASGGGGLAAGLGDYETEGSTEELAAFNAAIIGGSLGSGGGAATATSTTTTAGGGTTPAGTAPAGGGKTMYDTQYPSIVPKSADLVVSYVDGPQASNYNQAVSIFGSKALSITWSGHNADIADAETSFPLNNMQAWIKAQNARGIPKPVVYAIYSGVGTNYAQVKQAVGTAKVSWWLSDWTGKPHTLPGADAVQYGAQASPSSPMITDPANAGGKTYDLSFVSPSFPYYGGAPKLTPPKKHSGQEVPKFTYSPPFPGDSGISIHFPAGSITADNPTAAATQAVKQLKAELTRLNLVSN